MPEFFKFITLIDLLDITIIAVVAYRVLLLMKGTRAIQMVLGIFLLIAISFASKFLGLKTTSWVLGNFTSYIFIILIVLFQPEIRRALAVFGETRMLGSGNKSTSKVLDEIVKAASVLANRQIGALIVIEGSTDLEHYIDTGETLKCNVTKDILISIFIPYSPLHDGAVLIKDGEILKAGCILPLSKKVDIGKNYGTRHRAALGITEETDAVSVTVSEEKGSITVAHKGVLSEELDADMLKIKLKEIFDVNRKGAKRNEKSSS